VGELADVSVLHPGIEPMVAGATSSPVPLGAVDGAASVGVPLSLLQPEQVAAIDRAADGGAVVVTPWRGLVVPGAAAALPQLQYAGLVTEEASVWSQLTACIGAPGCAKSRISTQRLAADLVDVLDRAPDLPVHLSGCERRCGAPAGSHLDLVAPDLDQARSLISGAR
jgi:precorrin-3B synthase